MTRRLVLPVIAVLILSAGVFYWAWPRRSPVSPEATAAQQAADAWLALRIQVFAAGREDDVLVTVTGYDRRARQAAIVRDATGGRWRGSGSGASAEPRTLAAGWAGRVRLEANGRDIPFTVTTEGADGRAVLRIDASRIPASGATLSASLSYGAGSAQSNTVTLPPATASRTDRLIALALQAELVGDPERLLAAGTELAALQPASAWGPYFTGVAHEARGDRAAAAGAFRQALARVAPGQEPPVGLVARIRRLSE